MIKKRSHVVSLFATIETFGLYLACRHAIEMPALLVQELDGRLSVMRSVEDLNTKPDCCIIVPPNVLCAKCDRREPEDIVPENSISTNPASIGDRN